MGVNWAVMGLATLVSLLKIRIRPQDLVVSLIALGTEIAPHGKAKRSISLLTADSHKSIS